ASAIVRAFVARRTFDGACAHEIPPLRLVPAFARSIGEVAPANAAVVPQRDGDLRCAADAVWAAADALARVTVLGATAGSGLRGGSFAGQSNGDRTVTRLQRVRWTNDLAVDGTVTFDAHVGRAEARLAWPGAVLRAIWPTYAA